jgi:hypothetical protein
MKRFLICAMLFLLCAGPCATAYAVGTDYSVNDQDMAVNIPDGWAVFTPSTNEDDPNLKKYNLDWQTLMQNMKNRYITIIAYRAQPLSEINILSMSYIASGDTNGSDTTGNFNKLEDSDLDIIAKSTIESTGKDSAIKYSGHSLYTHGNIKYIVFDFSQETNNVKTCGKQYFTVVNGLIVSAILHSYEVRFLKKWPQRSNPLRIPSCM